MRMLRMAGLGVLVVTMAIAVAMPASAVKWKSRSKPLYGYEDGNKFGKVYGKFYNNGQVSADSQSWQFDMQSRNKYPVRVETDFYFWEWDTLCAHGAVGGDTCWQFDVSKQTATSSDPQWHFHVRGRNLHFGADRVRGGIDICEIRPWRNDPCSAHAYPSFRY